jgi:hypothetical protein
MARPSEFTQEVADKILDRISEGEMLTKICQEEGMPPRKTVYTWMGARPAFKDAYARAREEWAEFYEEKVLAIAFDDKGDFFIEDGKAVADHARVQRARLQVDTLKWFMMKWAPRRYGEKPVVEQPRQLEVSWIVTGVPRADDPPVPPRPPAQITYDPGPLPKRIDPEIIARFLRMIKDTVPRADQRPPEEVLTLALDVCERALKAEFTAEIVCTNMCTSAENE